MYYILYVPIRCLGFETISILKSNNKIYIYNILVTFLRSELPIQSGDNYSDNIITIFNHTLFIILYTIKRGGAV